MMVTMDMQAKHEPDVRTRSRRRRAYTVQTSETPKTHSLDRKTRSRADTSPLQLSDDISPDLVDELTRRVLAKLIDTSSIDLPHCAIMKRYDPRQFASPTSLEDINVGSPPSLTHRASDSSFASSTEPSFLYDDAVGQEERDMAMQCTDQAANYDNNKPVQFGAVETSDSVHIDDEVLCALWQPLFEQDQPTTRLSQFLRSIAKTLTTSREDRDGVVVLPHELRLFFAHSSVEPERFQWSAVFGVQVTNTALSSLYKQLECQHHLCQVQSDDTPSVPGLTMRGFQAFMTLLIRADPDREHLRLCRVLRDFPMQNAENTKEYFPAHLPRCLLPIKASPKASQLLSSCLDDMLRTTEQSMAACKLPRTTSHVSEGADESPDEDPVSAVGAATGLERNLAEPQQDHERARQPYNMQCIASGDQKGTRCVDNKVMPTSISKAYQSFVEDCNEIDEVVVTVESACVLESINASEAHTSSAPSRKTTKLEGYDTPLASVPASMVSLRSMKASRDASEDVRGRKAAVKTDKQRGRTKESSRSTRRAANEVSGSTRSTARA